MLAGTRFDNSNSEAQEALDARKGEVLEEANERLKTGQALIEAAGNSMNVVVPEKSSMKPRSSRRSNLHPPDIDPRVTEQPSKQPPPEPVVHVQKSKAAAKKKNAGSKRTTAGCDREEKAES